MPNTITYILVSLSFTATYICGLASLVIPKWLIFESPRPHRAVTNYGLFQKCSTLDTHCREFPLIEFGDCEEEGFCEEWKAARINMIIAAVLGGLTLIYCLGVFFSGKFHKEQIAWKIFVGLIGFHAILQYSTIALITHLYYTSDKFYYGVKYDISFLLVNISSVINILLSGILFRVGWNYVPSYQTID
ncbi:hypothetical protein RhiirA5_414420 [Rhizophagus irregularis]|uniref:Uncharacterized protein n=3 Tax=Rhizophagus irregularis TaxID=588596 RepID=A0A2I1E512_9GLOM|nr:hypothetical protein GLOIN_2v1774473 [Rhizophagus irregularis DAOM 181602=DAOM 197198]EXX75653.1 hypothetical protein RirG_040140 [Rhizophagus irregularis DAOM 197198w]PKC10387.1 hypothetical protein RhiirA5_414420 [Rhizophagus irregularis]PKC65844.1 hypothetical protein RhiirA1_460523 [Rhizophagus irregularis]PKY17206.1 hypothetical protein RhiirB3_429756 [Rhizophagus irregularis]POG71766.1 hypothetical protein GLOIN_2v1774473 [Rhizophagus irregularis DAOM 181602=DAOM 197198]|eukprot:XP_025178632.1 hypothetical protein GLOIN_2v1774473 [Rhizophagus irregularis DAOM 181602=DAOM 197198]